MEFFSLMLLNLWLKYFWYKWRCTNYLIMCLEFIKQVFTCLLNGMKYKMKMHKHICKNITMVYHPKQKEQPNWKKKKMQDFTHQKTFSKKMEHWSKKYFITSMKAHGSSWSSLTSKWYAFSGPKAQTISITWISSIGALIIASYW